VLGDGGLDGGRAAGSPGLLGQVQATQFDRTRIVDRLEEK
jgi:hypothetical protein